MDAKMKADLKPKTVRIDRETVIRAAAEIADAQGLDAVTLSTVAQALHKNVSSLYNHVDGFEGLIHGIALLAVREIADALWQAGLGRSGREGIVAQAHAFHDFMIRRPERFKASLQTRIFDADLMAEHFRCNKAIRAVIASFDLDKRQIAHATRILTASIVGFCAVYEGVAQQALNPPVKETFDLLVDNVANLVVSMENRSHRKAHPLVS